MFGFPTAADLAALEARIAKAEEMEARLLAASARLSALEAVCEERFGTLQCRLPAGELASRS